MPDISQGMNGTQQFTFCLLSGSWEILAAFTAGIVVALLVMKFCYGKH